MVRSSCCIPARTLGAIEFDKVLSDQGCTADVIVAEAETFIYASRSDGPAQARIFRIKEAVPLAALPATRTPQVLEALAPAYPQFIDGISVLHTGLNNMGAIFHPALTLLNAGRIESTHGDYQFYIDGVTPSVARVLEVLDRERVTVAASLGIRARTALEWLQDGLRCRRRGPERGDPQPAGLLRHQGAQHAQPSLHLRGRSDEPGADRCAGPALWRLGARHGRIIRLACIIHRTDYWRRGRTLEKLGIDRLSVGELTQYALEGERDWAM